MPNKSKRDNEMASGEHEFCASRRVNFADVALFEVPAHWVVDWVDVSGPDDFVGRELVIFEDVAGSGTLRPWTELYHFPDAEMRDATIESLHRDGARTPLSEAIMLSYAVSEAEEEGALLRLHCWTVTLAIAPSLLRLLTFNLAIEAENEASAQAQKEQAVIAAMVRRARYPESELPLPS